MSTRGLEFAKGGLLKKLLPIAVIAGLGYVGYTQVFPGGPSPVERQATEASLANLYGPTNQVVLSVGRISDPESAKAVVTTVKAETEKLNEIGYWLEKAHPAGKRLVMKNVFKSIRDVEVAQEAAYKISGVEGVLKPAIDPFLEKLRGISLLHAI